jgi:pyruvate/2-oxoglutarate dehydrogenase complex dihydrolipoamide acyltransferase (E2) component
MNMESATIVKWLKAPGESFQEGDPLYEIETEKVTQVVEAPGAGRLLEVLVDEDEEADVGEGVCVVESA